MQTLRILKICNTRKLSIGVTFIIWTRFLISTYNLHGFLFMIKYSERFLWSDETPEIKIRNSAKNLKILILILIFDSKWKYFLTLVGNFIHCMMHIFYKWRHFEVSRVKYFVTSDGRKKYAYGCLIPISLTFHHCWISKFWHLRTKGQ